MRSGSCEAGGSVSGRPAAGCDTEAHDVITANAEGDIVDRINVQGEHPIGLAWMPNGELIVSGPRRHDAALLGLLREQGGEGPGRGWGCEHGPAGLDPHPEHKSVFTKLAF
jgi:hypothetical protein